MQEALKRSRGDPVSERYGAPGEEHGLLEALESWIKEEISNAEVGLNSRGSYSRGSSRYLAGRMMALREVLDMILVNP
jgi:hypothetical protein